MTKMILEITDELAEALLIPEAEKIPRLRRELAVRLYEKGLLSFGNAREMAEMSKWDFHELLAAEGITRSYDGEELDADLETLELLG